MLHDRIFELIQWHFLTEGAIKWQLGPSQNGCTPFLCVGDLPELEEIPLEVPDGVALDEGFVEVVLPDADDFLVGFILLY
jgi:hypothetical protein